VLDNAEDRLRTWKNPTLAKILEQADGAAVVDNAAPESPVAVGCSGQAAPGSSGLTHTSSGFVRAG